ncbi:hypothetical protein ACFOU2_10650 [Bacillus songklensis]|uniref:Uncharacterized protein n=1 Tax=Bacillus songklensis TaxID=1069116 RepID=A0ABV8B3T1_9BACI
MKKEKEQPMNGLMVRNLKEMKEHAGGMRNMETNKELKEKKGMSPDPEQYDD